MTSNNSKTMKYPFSYNGNALWLILACVCILPVGITLLALKGSVRVRGNDYGLQYRGDKIWLLIWSAAFFPVAIVLGFLNGFDIIARQATIQIQPQISKSES